MDKLYAIKIKQEDGTYSDEIPINVTAQNVDYNNSYTLKDILGIVDTSNPIQNQINELEDTKASQKSVNTLDKKVDDAVEYISAVVVSEVEEARQGANGIEYNTLKQRLDTEYNTLQSNSSHDVVVVNEEPIDTTKVVINSSESTIELALQSDVQNAVAAEASARQAVDNNLQTQINQLIAPEGAAPSAAEIENARVGADGTVYPTLGDAIRGQAKDINTDMMAYNAFDILRDSATHADGTSNGVTFTWDADGERCTASGTSTGVSTNSLFTSQTALIPGIVAGGTYIFTYESTSDSLYLELYVYDANSTRLMAVHVYPNQAITFPAESYRMFVRIRATGTLSNAAIYNIAIMNTESNYTLSMTRAKAFATLADMQADRSLRVGQYAMTMGYYAEGDGGGALYRIAASRPASYHPGVGYGLYAIIIPHGEINAAAFGAIGNNDTVTKVSYAIQAAIDYNLNLRFPVDITIGGGITIPDDLNGKRITFDGDITYTGTVAALTLHNTKNITVQGNGIVCTGNAPGIMYLQDGTGDEAQTLYNTNVNFAYIQSAGYGVEIRACTWGILECYVHVERIRSTLSGIYAHCLGEDNENHSSFIGQMRYEIQHINSGGYAINLDGSAESSTITGVFIDSISFESSANGIRMRGDCKLVNIHNVRILEVDSFTWIINADGNLRYVDIAFTSPVRDDKLTIATSYGLNTKPVMIRGGIYSPVSFRFAEYLLVSSSGRIYGGDVSFERVNGDDFTFKADSASYRCFTRLINNSGKTITYNDVRYYFNPFGFDTLYITQNKDDGSVIKVMRGTTAIFDGTTVTDEGETTYMVKSFYNPSAGTIDYLTVKM